jgi:hypothetical protein
MFVIEGDDDNNDNDDANDVELQRKAQHSKNPENNDAHTTVDVVAITPAGSSGSGTMTRNRDREETSVTWRQVFAHKKSVIIGCGLMLFQVR